MSMIFEEAKQGDKIKEQGILEMSKEGDPSKNPAYSNLDDFEKLRLVIYQLAILTFTRACNKERGNS